MKPTEETYDIDEVREVVLEYLTRPEGCPVALVFINYSFERLENSYSIREYGTTWEATQIMRHPPADVVWPLRAFAEEILCL